MLKGPVSFHKRTFPSTSCRNLSPRKKTSPEFFIGYGGPGLRHYRSQYFGCEGCNKNFCLHGRAAEKILKKKLTLIVKKLFYFFFWFKNSRKNWDYKGALLFSQILRSGGASCAGLPL